MRSARILFLVPVLALWAPAALPVAAQDGVFQRSLSVSGPVTLIVETSSGMIQVRAGGESRVEIRGEIRAQRGWFGTRTSPERIREIEQNPPIEQWGNEVRIRKLDGSGIWRSISISYEITVPAGTDLRAATGSGSVRVDGLDGTVDSTTGSGSVEISRLRGALTARTGSGSITVKGARGPAKLNTGSGSIHAEGVEGRFHATTGSGSVQADLIRAEAVEISTGSGRIRVTGIQGSLRASTGSGSIHAEGEILDDWSAGTSSGGITVVLPGDSQMYVRARTSSGAIQTDFPVTTTGKVVKGRLEGPVRGGGPTLELGTSSGGIRIKSR